ncbi:MAG TPA: DUF5684 domain-containing protein [Ktedonobacterales bacterium]|nr:DUF5684 domain-containing protein [Ktedonobacterales bacterium]
MRVLADSSSGAAAGSAVAIIIVLAILLFYLIAYWRIFSKAGKPGILAFIPIVNSFILLSIVGRPWWWFFLFAIPFVDLVVAIIVINDLSKSYGHGAGFTLGLIFLSFIFIPVLGYGGSRYIGPAAQMVVPVPVAAR